MISELEDSLNDDDAIDASGITEGQTKTLVFVEVLQKEYTPMGEVDEEVEANVVTEE